MDFSVRYPVNSRNGFTSAGSCMVVIFSNAPNRSPVRSPSTPVKTVSASSIRETI